MVEGNINLGTGVRIHATADVSKDAVIGKNTSIWNFAQIRERARIGENCIIAKNVYVDFDVKIGNNVKIQNNVSVYHGVEIDDGVFVGPHVCFTNDKNPRAINPDGTIKKADDWEVSKIKIRKGASIGANSTILPGVEIGEFALIGGGSVVTKNIGAYEVAYGNPARVKGYVCKCAKILNEDIEKCSKCDISLNNIEKR
jgi:UDP-2-acetamido-3-amino-2,3-dideoxy-glucuronate N-acetyltransferase